MPTLDQRLRDADLRYKKAHHDGDLTLMDFYQGKLDQLLDLKSQEMKARTPC